MKIGVLGLTTEYTPYMVEKSAFEAFEMAPAAQAAHRWVPQMRAEGAEVVVALTHMPFYVEENGAISGEMHTLLGSMPGVDVCIGGHIPGDYAAVQNGTCVVKAGFGGVSLGHIRLGVQPAGAPHYGAQLRSAAHAVHPGQRNRYGRLCAKGACPV